MDNLYNRIEALGKTHGYKTMTALCRAADVPRATMSELKMGRSKDLSKPNAQKFANILGVSLDEIYGIEQGKPADEIGELSKEELDYIKWFRHEATEKEKALVRMIVEGHE